jgi:hypothetical protein
MGDRLTPSLMISRGYCWFLELYLKQIRGAFRGRPTTPGARCRWRSDAPRVHWRRSLALCTRSTGTIQKNGSARRVLDSGVTGPEHQQAAPVRKPNGKRCVGIGNSAAWAARLFVRRTDHQTRIPVPQRCGGANMSHHPFRRQDGARGDGGLGSMRNLGTAFSPMAAGLLEAPLGCLFSHVKHR